MPIDPETLNPMIESYLMGNPRILQRVNDALQDEIRTAEAEQARAAIASQKANIYDDPDHIIIGNPNGDVTLVEMFDYNCTYCRGAVPDMATLLADDPNLRVILKEFPILSEGSVDAARIAVLVSKDPKVDYWDFHQKLFSVRGQADVLSRMTAIFASIFFFLSLLMAWSVGEPGSRNTRSIMDNLPSTPGAPADTTAPAATRGAPTAPGPPTAPTR